jgi:predicted transcriptional regulator
MLDFACKQFDIQEVIKCSLGLSKAEFQVLDALVKNPDREYQSQDLAKRTNLNVTTVQRAVKKLHEKGAIDRFQKNLAEGGYYFVYKVKEKRELRRIVLSTVQHWTRKVDEELEKW